MHVISKKIFIEACKEYPKQRESILNLYRVLEKSSFSSPDEMRKVFRTLDNFKYKDKWWVIDIGGKKLRMVAFIQFVQNRIYIKHIASHAKYDKLCKEYSKRGDK